VRTISPTFGDKGGETTKYGAMILLFRIGTEERVSSPFNRIKMRTHAAFFALALAKIW
jgi:hypothetical protein